MKAYSLSYYVRLAKGKQGDGYYRLLGRITINKKRNEFSLNRQIPITSWDMA